MTRYAPRRGLATDHPLYARWGQMKQRCFNPTNQAYKQYGGRGILVCDRWLDFWNFVEDMGPRPAGTTVERIDNDSHYEPINCRWATAAEQLLNKRRPARLVTFNGITKPMRTWERDLGHGHNVVRWRLLNGWSISDALNTPSGAMTA